MLARCYVQSWIDPTHGSSIDCITLVAGKNILDKRTKSKEGEKRLFNLIGFLKMIQKFIKCKLLANIDRL